MKFELNEYKGSISDEALIKDVERVAKIYNKDSLTQEEYLKFGKYGTNTFRRHFQSWNNVLKQCGLRANKYQLAGAKAGHNYCEVTNEQLITDFKEVADVLGVKKFSSGTYKKYGKYSISTVLRRFGSWNSALKQAGLNTYGAVSGKRIADEKLLNEIERIWIELGRQPTTSDIKKGISNYSLNVYCRHFGGWRNALEHFKAFVNSESLEEYEKTCKNSNDKKATIIKKELLPPSVIDSSTNNNDKKVIHKTVREANLRLRFRVMQRDNFKCKICGASPATDPSVELHIDHIVPWSKGGETVIENLQTLCSKCNLGKSDLG